MAVEIIERGRPAEASDIVSGLLFFWMIRGHAAEGLQWYEQILNLPLPPEAESKALFGAAAMRFTQGELDGARTAVARALTIAQRVGRRDLIAQTENLFGYVEHAAGNMDAARDRFTRSIEAFRASGRRGSWARRTPSLNVRARRLSTGRCGTSETRSSARFVRVLARIGGTGRTRRAV